MLDQNQYLLALAAALVIACGNDSSSDSTGSTGGSGLTGSGGASASGGASGGSSPLPSETAGDPHYRVDQFGYLPAEEKVAVVGCATAGFNAPEDFAPGGTLEVRTYPEGTTVFSGAPAAWNGGRTDELAGDKGWWFDFSSVTTPGEYVIYDTERQLRSHVFRIADDVYADVLVQAMRTYYYQREGFEKVQPYADARWTDGSSHPNDLNARSVFDKENAATERDVSGGWMDAGDQNKYVTFLDGVIPILLYAYRNYPNVFTDVTGIPESGNGVPDLLDELDWEMTWLLKMQDDDGGVFIKSGSSNTDDPSPPSSDTRPRYYGKKCTSSSISFAGIVAEAAVTYREVPALSGKVAAMTSAAEQAWSWFLNQPTLDEECDQGEVKSGDADQTASAQEGNAARAAFWLWQLTGASEHHDYFRLNYTKFEGISSTWWGPYRAHETDVAALYATLPDADVAVAADIRDSIAAQESNCGDYYGFSDNQALYRAYMTDSAFHWGSNNPRATVGTLLYRMLDLGYNAQSHDTYRKRALQHLHWLHGVNALGKVYLSNMGEFGAEDSVSEFFHTWFAHGTDWDSALTSSKGPAPGYLVGGPNTTYGTQGWEDPATQTISPPYGQPGEKAYKDFNEGWPEASYAVTENAIYYQAAYVRLLAAAITHGS